MKIVTILGARPQFIKAAMVSKIIAKHNNIKEVFIHTGQHFDENMSGVFLREFEIPKLNYFLHINRLNHGAMTGQMLEKIENILLKEKPDKVLVYGDTNTTLAGALAAKKLHIRIAHVEAGLRSFNQEMPEEINRILTDRISDILFCPTEVAVKNLKNEGYENFECKIINSGDVMKDVAYFFNIFAKKPAFKLPYHFILATIHRAENTDNLERLKSIFNAFNKISKEINIVLPIHPRTKKMIKRHKINPNFMIVAPVGYLEMIYLLKNCSLVMTDSGGLQKEAFFFKRPSLTLRNETEWVELVQGGFTVLTGSDKDAIYENYKKMFNNKDLDFNIDLYGNGNASEIIVRELLK